jgi:hypothetical protein
LEALHREWKIRATARALGGDRWSATIEVWQPGQTPHAHSAVTVPFTDASDSAVIAEEHALAAGRRWVDRQAR